MKICAVQIRPRAGNIETNISKHLEFVELAAFHQAAVVYFPELSLTGYEPSLAKSVATDMNDPRLDVFQRISDAHNLIIGVGLPLSVQLQVQIGMVWFVPHEPRRNYAKQRLHVDELPYFVEGNGQLIVEVGGNRLAPAICYESLQVEHADLAVKLGANVYLASVAKSAAGVVKASTHYPEIARKSNMYVVMANCVGRSDNFLSVGQSAVWDNKGALLAQMDTDSEGIVMVDLLTRKANIFALPNV
jgi:predicted amidohydrolase